MSIQAVAWVLDHSDTQKTERCVLIAAANHTDYLGLFYAGAELLAHEARCSERHAVRLRQALADPDRPGGPAIRQLTESEIEALPDEHPYRRIRPDRRPPIFEMVGFPRPDRTSPRGHERGDKTGRRGDKTGPTG